MRLDLYLSNNKYCDSRNKAATLIQEGKVLVNGRAVLKPSYAVADTDKVEIDSTEFQYVARSAKKLLTAIDKFGIDFTNKTAVDLGSSTGGFCQVMLNNNALKVYAVDIGTNQLHSDVKSNKRVVCLENTNARYLKCSMFNEQIDIVTCDLSFISVKLILNSAFEILKQDGEFVCLVKPQFEVGAAFVGKNGVVKDKRQHINAVTNVINSALSVGFSVYGACFSGLAGESGNKEYLIYLKKDGLLNTLSRSFINDVILGS